MTSPYITCLVCGRLTPVDRGRCYHCHSPLPSEVKLPRGYVICMNCLRVTPADSGFCRHCRAPFPPEVVEYSSRVLRRPASANIEFSGGDGEGGEASELAPLAVYNSYDKPIEYYRGDGSGGAPRPGAQGVVGSGRGPDVSRVE